MREIKQQLVAALERQLDIDRIELEIPPEKSWGDLAWPCFELAKKFRQSPQVITRELAQKIQHQLIDKIEVKGAYINFFLNRSEVVKQFFQACKEKTPKKIRVIIEHMNANPNKPLHIGQARNLSIGDSMVRIGRYLGYQVDAVNYGDDSGVNVGYNILAHLEYGYPLETGLKFDHYCGQIYTEMRKKEEDPVFKDKLSQVLLAIEKGADQKINELQQTYTRKCAVAQFESCWRLNAFFDLVNWETDILHLKLFEAAFEKLKSSGYVKYADDGEAKGCWILDLSKEKEFAQTRNPYQILIKSDGVATYVAKDIVYAIWKLGWLEQDFYYQKLIQQPNGQWVYTTSSKSQDSVAVKFGHYGRALAVIDNRQAYAQNVVKKALEILGYLKGDKNYQHLSYGVVYLKPKTLLDFGFELSEAEQKQSRLPFSSRKGWTVTIDETFDLLKKKAALECQTRNPDQTAGWIDNVAEKVALGAMRFYLLRTDVQQEIVFDVDDALDLKGDTGMYVLYTYARIANIFQKAEIKKLPTNFEADLLTHELEFELVKEMLKQDEAVETAFEKSAPNLLCHYLLGLCRLFNSYYETISIIKSAEPLKAARLNLLKGLQTTLKEVMNLTGMIELERV